MARTRTYSAKEAPPSKSKGKSKSASRGFAFGKPAAKMDSDDMPMKGKMSKGKC